MALVKTESIGIPRAVQLSLAVLNPQVFHTFNFLLSYSCTISHFGRAKKSGFSQRTASLRGSRVRGKQVSMITLVEYIEAQQVRM